MEAIPEKSGVAFFFILAVMKQFWLGVFILVFCSYSYSQYAYKPSVESFSISGNKYHFGDRYWKYDYTDNTYSKFNTIKYSDNKILYLSPYAYDPILNPSGWAKLVQGLFSGYIDTRRPCHDTFNYLKCDKNSLE